MQKKKIQKVHSQSQLQKIKTFPVICNNNHVVRTVCPVSQCKYEMPPGIFLTICDLGWVVLQWDFSNSNKATKVETRQARYGLEPLMTNSPKCWHSWTRRKKEVAGCELVSQNPGLFNGLPDECQYTHLPVDRDQREHLTGHKAKFSGQNKTKGKHQTYSFPKRATKQIKTKENNEHLWEEPDRQKSRVLIINLYQSHYTQASSSHKSFFPANLNLEKENYSLHAFFQ